MTAIFEKELRSYFTGLSGYVFAAFLLLFAGIYTMAINLKSGYAEFEYVLQNMSFIFLIAIPILTMRVVAEERRQKTDQLLYALPVGMTRVVLGKYLAMLVIIALPTVVLGVYPLILSSYGSVSLPLAYGTLLAFFLLAAALGAVGLFLSSLTESQAVAAGLCFAVMLLLYFLSDLADYVSATAFASMIAFVVLLLLLAAVVRLLTGSAAAALGFGVVG
ncbi:MAG TPA: ABC transporter permease subunit, partial [Oscillospiraceae bacterium]|nr:ABC transporter permease subunit [Oscillospiraceae bacterium]